MKKTCLLKITVILLTAVLIYSLPARLNKNTQPERLVVYFPNWSVYSKADKTVNPGIIPWDKVSAVNHAFYTVSRDFRLVSTNPGAEEEQLMDHPDPGGPNGYMGEYRYFKEIYPNVKVLVSVGGWTCGDNFHAMAETRETRVVFINSVMNFLKKYRFIDGIDIDWEFPGADRAPDPGDPYDRGCPGGPEDKRNFTCLLKELRQAYETNGLKGKLLTVAAPASTKILEYQEPGKYAKYLDWINVMTYDMHGVWDTCTNHQSPIYANPGDPAPIPAANGSNAGCADYIMKYYRDHYKIPAYKLNAGSPFYSRGWKNVNPATGKNGLFAKADGAPVGELDNPLSPGGRNSYARILQLENTPGYVKYRDPISLVPWLYNKDEGIMYTYEDVTSAAARCDYVIKNGFGGIIVWEVTTDSEDFDLTSTISQKLGIASGK